MTIDSIGTQTKIIETILERGEDYLLTVKENQSNLKEDMEFFFGVDRENNFENAPYQHAKITNKGRGCIEIRWCWCISDLEYYETIHEKRHFPGIKTLVMIENERWIGEKGEIQTQFCITSLECDAERILRDKRSHREIENCVHWVLDIAFNEDHSRVLKEWSGESGNHPANGS